MESIVVNPKRTNCNREILGKLSGDRMREQILWQLDARGDWATKTTLNTFLSCYNIVKTNVSFTVFKVSLQLSILEYDDIAEK